MLNQRQRIVLLDGRGTGDGELSSAFDMLTEELERSGAELQTFSLSEIKMGSCIGCFGCWLKTPGICVERDVGRDIAQAVVQSDTTILFSPVTFGGYSSEIKKTQDRWIPNILPDFGIFHGEIHHKPRYSSYPRLVGIGIQCEPNEKEAELFRVLVGRNALNFHAPTYAAEVALSTDAPDKMHKQLQDVLVRSDAFPLGKAITSLMPRSSDSTIAPPTNSQKTAAGKRALLIVGSPKVKSPSTSRVLGEYVLKQLEQSGWESESLTLRGTLLKDKWQAEFLESVDRADLILLVFPLYIDALPFLMTKALELMAEHFTDQSKTASKQVCAISNNGFAEAYNNAVALGICRQFATDSGMTWLGGLAMGAGEALFRGKPFEETRREGPPVTHVAKALEIAGDALADGIAIPQEAIDLIAKNPIPIVPFRLWRWLFIRWANKHWRRGAAENDVDPEALSAQPYADIEGREPNTSNV